MEEYFNYTISIKSKEKNKINIINQLLILVAVVFLGKIVLDNYSIARLKTSSIFLAIVIVIILIIWIFNLLKKSRAVFRYAFFLAGLSFIFYFPDPFLKYLLGGLFILLGLLERYVLQAKQIKVDKSGVLVVGLPGKFYEWNKISNMKIKDQILTIDFADNKLYQKEIDGELAKEMENEFNSFARNNILKSGNAMKM